MASRNPLFNISRLIDESAQKEVSTETSFSEDLKLCIEKLNARTNKPSIYYKPSSLSCIRNMYYQRVGADVDGNSVSSDLVGIGESGTDRHLRIQYYISSMRSLGIDCDYVSVPNYIQENNLEDLEVLETGQYETKLYNKKYSLRFMLDGLILYKGIYYILEIKTESSYKWMNREGVDAAHFNQAYTYSMCLDIPRVLFIYENRDCCTKKIYLLNVTEDNRQSIKDKIDTCESYVHTKIVPPKPENVDKKVCQYCEYRKLCRRDK